MRDQYEDKNRGIVDMLGTGVIGIVMDCGKMMIWPLMTEMAPCLTGRMEAESGARKSSVLEWYMVKRVVI